MPSQLEKTLSACDLVAHFADSAKDIPPFLENLLLHIENYNPKVNALTSVEKNAALERAQQIASAGVQKGQSLFGVPIIIKENIQKRGYSVQCASRILQGYRGQFNATVVEDLERAGAIVIGTSNMDEFAMGSSNEHSVHGPVKNPHDTLRVSGGSSGGSAVACALSFAPVALGSDTGGSVRQPAAYCGIYGLKPSYGRVSRYGLVAYGSSLDQISPFARSARDLDLMMSVIGHEDVADSTTLRGHYASHKTPVTLKGTRIGILRSVMSKGVDTNVIHAFTALEKELQTRGAEIVDIEIEGLEHTLSVYYLIACAEASSNLSRFDGIRYGHRARNPDDLFDLYCKSRAEGFGDEVKLRIMLGTFALSAGYYDAYYGKAQAVRNLIAKEFENKFRAVDFIFTPTAPSSAFKIGENATDSIKMYLNDIFTIPANLAGLCGISLPARVNKGDLPVGLQFLGAKGDDAKLVAFATALEDAGLVGVTPVEFAKLR